MKKPLKSYKITSKFGNRYFNNKIQFHNGIDLAAPTGTPIYSPADGIVSFLFSNNLGGLQLGINHKNGYKTGYAHLSKANFKVGDKVKEGDIIAEVGNSGASTGSHLHFTLRQGDTLINPENVFNF